MQTATQRRQRCAFHDNGTHSTWAAQRRQQGGVRRATHPPPPASTINGGQLQLTGSCYEEIIDALSRRTLAAMRQREAGTRWMVGIAGVPGSGKSTLASKVMERINTLHGGPDPIAAVLPMDGFHLYKRELDRMPDPKEAYARRGAHWTFDGAAFVNTVRRVRSSGTETVLAPSFNHGVGDPVPDDIAITPSHQAVLCEGNYVLLDLEPWAQLVSARLFDDTWFVDAGLHVAMARVFARQTGLGLAPDTSRARIEGNDAPNGQLVEARSRSRAAVLVPSSVPFCSDGTNSPTA